jgi:tetratricopeptide (TPR) repeat protein
MKRLILLLCVLLAGMSQAWASYNIAPDILQEYRELKTKAQNYPKSPTVQFEYAICLSYVGKVEEGSNTINRVRDLDPKFYEKALPRYVRAFKKNPNDPRAKYRLGFLYYFNRKYDLALAVLSEVASRETTDQFTAWALGYMAVIKGEQKKWSDGEALVRQALEIEPDAYALHAALAIALKEQGNIFGAMGELAVALQKRGDFEKYEAQLFSNQ